MNIKNVVKNSLCTGCGTCISLCPNESLKLSTQKGSYIPKVESTCLNCGICYKTCPGHSIDFKLLNLKIFNHNPQDYLIGNYSNIFVGHSKDKEIRFNSSSGGMITQFLIYALENKIIDGALVTKMKNDNPLEPEPFIARKKEEIIEASTSKYCPVPVNSILKEILKSKGEKFAVVGLPCHIAGIRKAEELNKNLKDKIILHLGLFCAHTPNFKGTTDFLSELDIENNQIKNIYYRGDGWPGLMSFNFKNGQKKTIDSIEGWQFISSIFYYPYRCLMCNDHTAELADISFGDAWHINNENNVGESILICRNQRIEETLEDMEKYNTITKSESSTNDLKKSQDYMLFKKKMIGARMKIFKFFGNKTPFYNRTFPISFKDYIIAFSLYTEFLLIKHRMNGIIHLKHNLKEKINRK